MTTNDTAKAKVDADATDATSQRSVGQRQTPPGKRPCPPRQKQENIQQHEKPSRNGQIQAAEIPPVAIEKAVALTPDLSQVGGNVAREIGQEQPEAEQIAIELQVAPEPPAGERQHGQADGQAGGEQVTPDCAACQAATTRPVSAAKAISSKPFR